MQGLHFMKLIKFTSPAGNPVWVNPETVCSVEKAVDGDHAARTRLVLGGGVHYLQEKVEEVVQRCGS